MVARISPDDIVIYANGALATYLGARKSDLVGTPLDVLAKRTHGEISTCFSRPESGRSGNQLVTDGDGRVFEVKQYSEGGVLDIVLDEVTNADAIGRELRDFSGTAFDSLSEEELRTTRYPERRYLTVARMQLRGLAQYAERLPPMEVRLMVNSFVEEACDAILDTRGTVGETSDHTVMGIFGAPRHYVDHPLRAIQAACDQAQKATALHAGFHREGKELPTSSCGIWTGETLVGTMGSSARQNYTAVGSSVDLATALGQLARPGEILLPEHTLTHFLRTLPEGWQHIRAESEYPPDLSDFEWSGDGVVPVPEALRKVVFLVGPGVEENHDNVEYYFDYLWAYQAPGRDLAVPVLRVVRLTQVGDALELNDDNVVTAQAVQTLGKYKLIEVIGTGGMGRVWRGVDRFGNSVAIKVLHSAEAVTEVQLRRFRREAEVMARLPHRNICRVYETNEFEGIQYIAMEFVEGLTLSDLLYEKSASESGGGTLEGVDLRALISALKASKVESQARSVEEDAAEPSPRRKTTRILSVEQTLSILIKVCDAVQFAHEHGVLHRDLKPGNILLREDGEPLVADFGLAKLNSPEESQSLSVSGHVVGTMENMSPEQAESSKDVDERADVYSLGTMLYQMLTGRRHYEATGNIVTDAQALKTHEPIRLRALNPLVDPDLEIITLKALRNDPAERYRSVAALEADIQHYRRGEVISARPVSAVDVFKKLILRNKGVTISIAASILIFVAGVVVSIGILLNSLAEQRRYVRELEEKDATDRQKSVLLEEKTALIEDKEVKAALAEKNANLAAERATEALQKLEAAQLAVGEEQQKSSAAHVATEEEKRLREEAENDLAQTREALRQLEEATASAERKPRREMRERPPAAEEIRRQVEEEFFAAKRMFFLEMSPFFLQQMDRNPRELVRRLSEAMTHVSAALVQDPKFFPAWMLKGRLHLALMEYGRAAESFQQAEEVQDNDPGVAAGDDPAAMRKLTLEMDRAFGQKYLDGAQRLLDLSGDENQNAGHLLKFIAGHEELRTTRTDPDGPLGRSFTEPEVALDLMVRNSGGAVVSIESEGIGGQTKVGISGNPNLRDLTPLKKMDPEVLALSDAEAIDWESIFALTGLESLELAHCQLPTFPLTVRSRRSFLRLKVLRLTGTPISNLSFLPTMPRLEELVLTDTNVTDLSPLLTVRLPLRNLKIDGLNPANLRALMNFPLESLTVSPMLIRDKEGLDSLRMHRTLKILRAPGDPEDQPARRFWEKLDRGDYETSG